MDDNEMWQAVQTCDPAEARSSLTTLSATGKSLTSS